MSCNETCPYLKQISKAEDNEKEILVLKTEIKMLKNNYKEIQDDMKELQRYIENEFRSFNAKLLSGLAVIVMFLLGILVQLLLK